MRPQMARMVLKSIFNYWQESGVKNISFNHNFFSISAIPNEYPALAAWIKVKDKAMNIEILLMVPDEP
jgi:hypothetical protein